MGKVKLWFWCWQISHRGTHMAGTSLLGWSQHTERSNWVQWYSWGFLTAGGQTNWASSSLIWRLQSSLQSLMFITIQHVANLKGFYKASCHCEVTMLKNILNVPGWTTDKASLHQDSLLNLSNREPLFNKDNKLSFFVLLNCICCNHVVRVLVHPTFYKTI